MRSLRPLILLAALVAADRAMADPDNYVAALRGKALAIAGDCVACHTAPGGVPFAGGLALTTPFGAIMTPNITPDEATGIGRWSRDDFARAVHEGRRPNGAYLYPAFPYPYYARVTRQDTDSIYAYLRTLAPVSNPVNRNTLPFPFNIRMSMMGWNALFFTPGQFVPDRNRSEEFNRGAYLVEGLGHCGACHSPRNALGAERESAYLAGGLAEGWEAPPLTSLSHAPIPWSEDELYAYLRTGESRFHGVAAGPMAPVVKELAALPDQDIRAMAVYLGSFNDRALSPSAQQELAAGLETLTGRRAVSASAVGARLYQGACAVCHAVGGPPLFGSRPSLALNSNLHSATPDNLIRVILEGIASPASDNLGYMPGFRDSLSDGQVAELVSWLRQQFAPDKPPWTGVEEAIGRARHAETD